MYTFWISACILLSLAGCTFESYPGSQLINGQTPAVRAWNGGSAELLLEACTGPGNAAAMEQALARMITVLQSAGVLVSANTGSARLTVNFCGD